MELRWRGIDHWGLIRSEMRAKIIKNEVKMKESCIFFETSSFGSRVPLCISQWLTRCDLSSINLWILILFDVNFHLKLESLIKITLCICLFEHFTLSSYQWATCLYSLFFFESDHPNGHERLEPPNPPSERGNRHFPRPSPNHLEYQRLPSHRGHRQIHFG